MMSKVYDIFISYAHEDKEIAEVLFKKLSKLGLKIWVDELELKIGDSLLEEIEKAIKKSRYGIIILSRFYLKKNWPKEELKLFLNRKLLSGRKIILPIWHNITKKEIEETFPFLLDIKALSTKEYSLSVIAEEIYNVASDKTSEKKARSIYNYRSNAHGKKENEKLKRTLRKTDCKRTLKRTIQ